jgi:hypothetical protein
MRIFNKDSDVYPENELESCSYYYHKDFLPYIDPKTLMDAYKAAMTAETPTVTPPTPHALKYIFGGGVWIDWYCNSQVKWEGEFENSIKLLDSIEIMNLVDLNILNISRIGVRLGQALFPLEVEEKDSDKDRIRTCLTFKEISSCVASNVLTLEGIIKITRTKNAWQLTQTERPVRSSNLRLLFLLIAKQEVRDLILKDKEVTINRLLSDFSKQDVVKFEKEQDPVPQNILDIIKKGQSHFVRDFKDRQFEAKRISNEIAATVTRWYNFNFSPFGGPSGIDQIY